MKHTSNVMDDEGREIIKQTIIIIAAFDVVASATAAAAAPVINTKIKMVAKKLSFLERF